MSRTSLSVAVTEVAAGVAAIMCAGVVGAQEPELGSLVPSAHTGMVARYGASGIAETSTDMLTLAVGRDIAQCAVSRNPRDVETYLDMPADQPGLATVGRFRTAVRDCLARASYMHGIDETTLRVSDYTLRGLLAEAAVLKKNAASLVPAAAVRRSYAARWMSADAGRAASEEMGACLADLQPSASVALLTTKPGTSEERVLLDGLMPDVGRCLQKGATLRISPAGLRAAIAMGTYHRMVDAPSAQLADSKKN